MKASQIVNRVTIEARAVNVDQTIAAVEGLAVANDRTTRSVLNVAPALDRLRRSMDGEYRASQQLASGQRTLATAYQTGLISIQQQDRLTAQLQARYSGAASSAGRLAAANDNLSRSSSGAAVALSTLGAAATAALTAIAIRAAAMVALGIAAAQVGMQMQALERSFNAAAGSALQGGRELTFVKAESERLGLAVGETAKQYGQLLAASQGTSLQGQATRDIFIAVSQAMTALGKSSDDTGGALNAIQQMMSKGKVQAEELRGQLGERLPGAFNLAATAMGKTTAELNKMLDDGKILASDLLPKLAVELNRVYGAASAASANDLGANLNRLKTAWSEYQEAVARGGLNDALNRAAQALTRFLRDSDNAFASGQKLGAAIDWLVTSLERVPRGAENLGILAQMAREGLAAFDAWVTSMSALSGVAVVAGTGVGDAFSSALSIVTTVMNGIIGAAVAGYQMVAAAWAALPAVFGQIAKQAGDALIAGIEAAVNFIINGLNAFIGKVNAIGAMLPDAVGFKKIDEFGPAAFGRLTASAETAGDATSKLGSELDRIGKEAMGKNYLAEAGKAVTDAVDGQISRFNELRSAQDASNHLLREAGKIAKESKVADAYKNTAAAAKQAADATKEGGGAAKGAASAYEQLIQRTKDRIEELELEAQYASRTATEVIKLKLAHDLERAAKKSGIEVTEAMRAEWDKLGGSLASATQRLEQTRKAQADLKKAQDFVAESFSSFIDDLLTGADGLTGALKSLGKGFLSASIDALVSGKGPLAGITGLAANDNKTQGGLLGMLTALPKAVEKGAKAGTVDGVVNGMGTFAANDNFGLSALGIDGKQLAGGLTAIAGLAGAYGAGMSAGSVGQAAGGGAISGLMGGAGLATALGMTGSMLLPGIGLIIGAGLGIAGNMAAKEAAKKQREEQAQENYRQAAPGIETLRSQLRGESQDTLENRIKATLAEVQKGIDVAFFAKKIDEANALGRDFGTYKDTAISDFQRALPGLIDSLNQGFGPNSAFASARDQVKQTGDALKGLVSDAAYAMGADSPWVQAARDAARTQALAILDGAKSLSTVQTRMEEIRGAGTALQQILVDLGMSATDAAAAIQSDTIAALNRLKGAFQTDINAAINDAQGFGYVNDFNALFADVAQKMADAAALGLTNSNLDEYFRAKAQEIVDGAQLTGSAFDHLIAGFPQLAGVITEFTNGLKGAAREADIAARRLNAQDRLFGATNDNSTLAGQLAAYNRAAMREREAEIKAGGEALVDLEQAQAAERYNIIRDWNQKIVDDQKRAADEARSFWERFSKQIKEYTDGLRAGSDSPLSPQARLAAAQSQYNAQLALAQSGDRDALSGITSYSSDLLDAAKAYFASSTGYQDIFASVIAQLEALPDQVSETQLIINAIDAGAQATVDMLAIMKSSLEVAVNSGSAQQIAAALSTYFTQLDTNTSQSIDFNEMKTALRGMASESSLYSMFTRLDVDGSGSLDKLELIKTATGTIRPGIDTTNTSLLALAQISDKTGNTSIGVAAVKSSVDAVYTNTASVPAYVSQLGWLTTIKDQALRIGANTLAQANRTYFNGASNPAQGAYADGGYVSGPGSSTSDSISARLSDGEYVMRAAAVDRFGVGMLDQMNDNLRMPAMALPVSVGGQSNAALIAELRAVRAELADIKREMARNTSVTAAAGEQVAGHVDGVAAAVRDGTRDKDLLAA